MVIVEDENLTIPSPDNYVTSCWMLLLVLLTVVQLINMYVIRCMLTHGYMYVISGVVIELTFDLIGQWKVQCVCVSYHFDYF